VATKRPPLVIPADFCIPAFWAGLEALEQALGRLEDEPERPVLQLIRGGADSEEGDDAA
jgi:hypothetical protein